MNSFSGFLITDVFMPLLNSLWQGASIAALIWIVMRFLPRLNAATRYAIWWAVLAAVLLLPLVPGRQPSQPAPAIVRSSTGSATNPLLPQIEMPAIVRMRPASPPRWPIAIAALWTAVFLYRSTRIARSFLYLRRVKAGSFASSKTPPANRARCAVAVFERGLLPYRSGLRKAGRDSARVAGIRSGQGRFRSRRAA